MSKRQTTTTFRDNDNDDAHEKQQEKELEMRERQTKSNKNNNDNNDNNKNSKTKNNRDDDNDDHNKAKEKKDRADGEEEAAEEEDEDKMDRNFDLSYDYFGLDQKEIFEMIERKSIDMFHALGGTQTLAQKLRVNVSRGIDAHEVEERQKSFGVNILNKREPPSFLEFLIEAASDQVVIILAVAAVVSIVLGMTVPNPHSHEVEYSSGWIEGTAIIISILVVTLTGSINNYQKALQFQEMEKEQSIKDLFVHRSGHKVTIKSDALVVGDVLYLDQGMELSVDGLIIHASDLIMSEAAITGEAEQIVKNEDEDPFLISGTSVDEGSGQMLVIGVGMNSFQGHLKRSLDEEQGETPLQEHLSELADQIGYFGFALAFILVAGLSIKEGILVGTNQKILEGTNFLNFFLIAVTLVVVAIPEGLPLAVTIALAFSMKAMMAEDCMVRVLASCETMGAATAVCSDKTGTLTTNVMTCVQGCIGGEEFLIDGYGCHPRASTVQICDRKKFAIQHLSPSVIKTFCQSLALNSTAGEENINNALVWRGNRTEIGMLKLLSLMKYDYKTPRSEWPVADHHVIRQFPFNSGKKRMSTIVREDNGSLTLHVKGASEIVLESCDFFMNAQGNTEPMTDDARDLFESIIEDIALQGNRTIGVAFAPNCSATGSPNSPSSPNSNSLPKEEPDVPLVFLGIMGIMDPIRETVPESVNKCHSAGLVIRMCTGDNITTAVTIAKKCHIYEDNGWDIAMLGVDFRKKHDSNRDELMAILPRLKVLARSSPNDKYLLVQMLKEQGEVVGVTGDGTNDAPALKLADVGFAMKSGTDIARGASDMVLLDDNFATVVTAIKWGRAVNDNIKKFLQFQLTINVAGVLLTLVASLASVNSKEPFTPVQLLWLNLIMDTLAALSLATELPEEAALLRSPVYKAAPLITKRMWLFIAVHGTWQFTMILVLLFFGHHWFVTIEDAGTCDNAAIVRTVVNNTFTDPTARYCETACLKEGGSFNRDSFLCQQGDVHSTILFNIFIWTQVVNVINSRKVHGEQNPLEGLWSRSKQLLIIFVIIAGFQAIAVELFGRFISTTGLSGKHWGICLGIAVIEIFIGILQRLIPIHDEIPEEILEKQEREEELREKVAKSNSGGGRGGSASSPFAPAIGMTPAESKARGGATRASATTNKPEKNNSANIDEKNNDNIDNSNTNSIEAPNSLENTTKSSHRFSPGGAAGRGKPNSRDPNSNWNNNDDGESGQTSNVNSPTMRNPLSSKPE